MYSHGQIVTTHTGIRGSFATTRQCEALSKSILAQVVALGSAHVVTYGAAIHRTGQPFRSLFYLRSGAAKRILLQEDGREQILGFPMPGDIIGMEAIGGGHTAQRSLPSIFAPSLKYPSMLSRNSSKKTLSSRVSCIVS